MDFRQLVGDGRLTVTIEAEERAARYQGIVALEGASLAGCLENYFATSEQLPTRIALVRRRRPRPRGVLLQKLPAAGAQGEALAAVSQDAWEELQTRPGGARWRRCCGSGTAEQVLQRVCGEHDCRLFVGAPVRFACRCSEGGWRACCARSGRTELRSILAEQGAVTVTCEFCGRPFRFDADRRRAVVRPGSSPEAPRSLN